MHADQFSSCSYTAPRHSEPHSHSRTSEMRNNNHVLALNISIGVRSEVGSCGRLLEVENKRKCQTALNILAVAFDQVVANKRFRLQSFDQF